MANGQSILNLTEKCNIYFEDSLISKELLIKKYTDFLTASFASEQRSINVAIHTGSFCFDVISLIVAALGCLTLDSVDSDLILAELTIGDMVLYKNERYHWCGTEMRDNRRYLILEQDGRGRNGEMRRFLPYESNKNLIVPYFGDSDTTDGRGIKKESVDRIDFLSYLLNKAPAEIPSTASVSVIIVSEREKFERAAKGIKFVYAKNKSIGLLDVVTASYYADGGEEYPYGGNPAKIEPALKITRKVSTARNLILEKHGNPAIGLMILGSDDTIRGKSELTDLTSRKSLKFIYIITPGDFELAEDIIKTCKEAALFACTKSFLIANVSELQEYNPLTIELNKQIGTIIHNTASTIIVDGGCSWDMLCQIKKALCSIKQSNWDSSAKDKFIVTAYSLLKLFMTAAFPMEILEQAIELGRIHAGVSSPKKKLDELWELTENAGSMDDLCFYVADALEYLYSRCFSTCTKYDAIKQRLALSSGQRIAVVIPKEYYEGVLRGDKFFGTANVTFVSANRLNALDQFDELIVTGDFSGTRFNPLKCRTAISVVVLLYECETHYFKYKQGKIDAQEQAINAKIGIISDDIEVQATSPTDNGFAKGYDENSLDLEDYIQQISTFDIKKFANEWVETSGPAPMAEICAVGRFTDNRQILFSKYYGAVVFDAVKGAVTETNTENLIAGDVLVFIRRDDYTRNMVDFLYERLQKLGRLSKEVVDATEKAWYWKEVLREYKTIRHLSYRDVAKELQKLGSTLQEVTIRQWLFEESHIVGPREEKAMEQIAVLTQDSYLLSDTQGYFEACRIVRRQRKAILQLIGKAIADKLSGCKSLQDDTFEVIYDNVEELAELLELENVTILEQPITVPINLINKPIDAQEVFV